MKKSNSEISDVRDKSIVEINFFIGGYLGSSHDLTVSKQDADMVYYHYQPLEYEYKPAKSQFGLLPVAQWNTLIHDINKLGVFKWDENYCNPDIMDGTNWSLCVILDTKERITYSGVNAFPSNFDMFLEILHRNGFTEIE